MTEQDWESIKEEEGKEKLRLQKEFCARIRDIRGNPLPCYIEQTPICPKCFMEILFYYKKTEAEYIHITKCRYCGYSLVE